jgi:hypothetical protein
MLFFLSQKAICSVGGPQGLDSLTAETSSKPEDFLGRLSNSRVLAAALYPAQSAEAAGTARMDDDRCGSRKTSGGLSAGKRRIAVNPIRYPVVKNRVPPATMESELSAQWHNFGDGDQHMFTAKTRSAQRKA